MAPKPNPLDSIEHFVVLMMENRSFDHMLGYLSLNGDRPDVDGLKPGMSNNDSTGKTHPIRHLDTLTFAADPCHSHGCVIEQYNDGAMDGFVRNFEQLEPTPDDPGMIMGYYDAADVPMYDFLAREFLICDRWFCSVLGPTLPNRAFSLGGESGGITKNPSPFPPPFKFPPVFQYLSAAKASWRYFTGDFFTANLRLYKGYAFNTHEIDLMASFFKRAKNGNLPRVSWIDPDFGIVGNNGKNDDHPPVDITRGQRLVRDIYEAIRTGGNDLWKKTMFIVTYDEHGGFFDHVKPPECADARPDFRRLGIRVPALIASPWVARGGVSHTVFDHTSILRTILERFCRADDGSIPSMTARVDAAVGLGELILPAMRTDAPIAPEIPLPLSDMMFPTPSAMMTEPVPIPAPADDTDDFDARMLELRAAMMRQGLQPEPDPDEDEDDILDHGPDALASTAPESLAEVVSDTTASAAPSFDIPGSIASPNVDPSITGQLPGQLFDGVELRIKDGELVIRISGDILRRGTQETGMSVSPSVLPSPAMDVAFAEPPPPPPLVLRSVPADKFGDGFANFQLRSDLADSYVEAFQRIKALGGLVTSSGAIRALNAAVSAGRSATSLHYTGRALDLFIHSGMTSVADPYVVVRDGGTDEFPLWHVFAVSVTPDQSSPLFDGTLIAERELTGTFWSKHKGFTTAARRAKFFSVTDILRQSGWTRIPSRRAWKTEYLSVEWWHFQNHQGLVVGQSKFGEELRKIWPADKVAASGLRTDAVWAGQSFRAP